MAALSAVITPAIIAGVVLFGLVRGVAVFDCFIEGAVEGLKVVYRILPTLIALLTAVSLFEASGALEIIGAAVRPLTDLLHIPSELVPLAILRPVSGSGSISLLDTLLASVGPDSFAGRVACVMLASTETTFYTFTLYYASAGVKRTRHTLAAALVADVSVILLACVFVRLFFPA
ncbi:nucleoside recognition domain-containing protein [Feifania hominis]|uniref:Spore maturation protein n=1 Tax=Feifania hominis TaxID=2763660 RepID=A0A926HQS5_9FIRM|nr:spore maturation protein [Feifania hominis]